ncbi:MauE/DoxX family redox-associated membrane protein [Chitinophaga silvisoli]|uniref:Methylamine utilisation protein MauE domain-containing protein n=1 Tax=Chitinophaga silvisoli TaxID=2291814 RepID=A0A3E1P425_9BACT|nr:MauE/DoxX family redox-associated membrane protein [Chitinophaga silvisoli]RFM34758.1 hypothetical protein DXN04_15580 [Chitinophaga silvisoli]
MSIQKTAISTCKNLLVMLFLYTAISKLLNYSETVLQMEKSPFITQYAYLLSWGMPVLEIIIAILLIVDKTRLYGFYASLFLMVLFTAYVFAMMHYSYYLPCSCGGILSLLTWTQHLWVNVFFIFVALTGTIFEKMNHADTKVFHVA